VQVSKQTISEALEAAMASYRAGDRAKAEKRCHDILCVQPGHSDANHLLGVLLYQAGDAVTGERYMRAALASQESVQALCDLALMLKAQKRLADAESTLRRAIAVQPDFVMAHQNLARLLIDKKDAAGAEAAFRRALKIEPNSADTLFGLGKMLSSIHRAADALDPLERAARIRPSAQALNSLGVVYDQLGRHEDALASFHRALELDSNFAEAHCNLGMRFVEKGEFERAEASLRAAIAAKGDFGGAHIALAKLYLHMKRPDHAIEQYQRAAELAPSDAGMHTAFGALLAERGHNKEAEAPLRRAVELNPELSGARMNLGNLLRDTGRIREAEVELRKAMELDPNSELAVYNLSTLMRDVRRLDEAEELARRVLELNPNQAAAYVSLGNALLGKNSGDITEALDAYRKGLEIDPDLDIAHSNLAYSITFATDDGYEILKECKRFSAQFEAPLLEKPVSFDNDRSPSRRLRVGYVSPDFREHCQALFTFPLLRNHDHDVVEVYCYSDVAKPDDTSRELSEFADVWREVHTLDDDQLAAQIREDRIDILVDLTMHMSRGRPMLYGRRPAPVQIAWLAYPGTTGSSAIDYRLTDPWLDPIATKHLDDRYTEKSIRLPDTFWCYDPLTSEPQPTPLPAKVAGQITFGCLNNPCKLSDKAFSLWAQAMKRVPNSRLALLTARGKAREDVVRKFELLGIEASRLLFLEYQRREHYLNTYMDIDIVLDTFPYNGHTTTLDALWMGVPVVSLTGTSPASRAGFSLLSNLQLQDLTTSDEIEFVEKAVTLATDLPRLENLRSVLRNRIENSPLMDGEKFARGMEQAFRQTWEEFCFVAQ
jgi:protein O-GlcNAc transferase